MLTNKTVQEIILDDDIGYRTSEPLFTQDQMSQTELTLVGRQVPMQTSQLGTDNVAEFIGKCLSVAMNGHSIQTPASNQKTYSQDFGQRSLNQSYSGYSQSGPRVTTCTSPSMPEC